MSILPTTRRLIMIAVVFLALPLRGLADPPAAPGPDHAADGRDHMHAMQGCEMSMGQEHGGMMHDGGMFADDGAMPHMLRHLQLSEAQQDKIFTILHAQAPQARELRKAMEKAHRGLHELVTTGPFDDAKAKALSEALGKALSDSALLHARTHHQILEVLTPDQRQELARHAEHGHGGDHGPGHHEDHAPMPQH